MESLEQLAQTPLDNRDLAWERRFVAALMPAKLEIMNPEPLTGPDAWPYLHARISPQGAEPGARILQWLSDRGIGLLVDHGDQQEYPDYVLSWGMVWYLNKTQSLVFDGPAGSEDEVEIDWTKVVRCGDPNEDYLPKNVRKIIREFFAEQEILTPRILALTLDGKNFDLAFSLESLGNPPEKEHSGILEALSWFLPPHYSLMLLSEQDSPAFFHL